MDTSTIVLIIAIAALLYFWHFSRRKRTGQTEARKRATNASAETVAAHRREDHHAQSSARLLELRQDLRRKVLYDEAKIDRLVQFEKERMPSASLEECFLSAIQRWERENR